MFSDAVEYHRSNILFFSYEEFRRRTSYAPKQKNLVFACNELALCYVKIIFRKTSHKAGCGRFAISVLLQNGISDSEFSHKTGYVAHARAPPPARVPRLRHGELLGPS